jgi:hypothetical protein
VNTDKGENKEISGYRKQVSYTVAVVWTVGALSLKQDTTIILNWCYLAPNHNKK